MIKNENKLQNIKTQMAVERERERERERESCSLKEGGFENVGIKPYRPYMITI